MHIDRSPYQLPTGSQLPANVVDWTIESDRAVLLIHDMQNYFLEFVADPEPRSTLVDHLVDLRRAADQANVPVVYTAQPGSMSSIERGLLADHWGPGMLAEPAHNAVIEQLGPRDQDHVLTKWRYSAFNRSRLRNLLEELGRDQLVIGGVFAHIGCMVTAADAYSLDIEPFLLADGVADFNEAYHQLALTWVAERCGSVVATEAVQANFDPTSRKYGKPHQADRAKLKTGKVNGSAERTQTEASDQQGQEKT